MYCVCIVGNPCYRWRTLLISFSSSVSRCRTRGEQRINRGKKGKNKGTKTEVSSVWNRSQLYFPFLSAALRDTNRHIHTAMMLWWHRVQGSVSFPLGSHEKIQQIDSHKTATMHMGRDVVLKTHGHIVYGNKCTLLTTLCLLFFTNIVY